MKTPREIVDSLERCGRKHGYCKGCAYRKTNSPDGCIGKMHEDAAKLIQDMEITFGMYGGDVGITAVYAERERLKEENRALRTELAANHIGDGNKKVETKPWGQYWENICNLNARQEAKGRKKYGEPLEENTTLTTTQRIEHAQEEAIDLLKYLEHLKKVANDGITANDYQRAAMRTDNKDQTEEERMLDALFGLCGEAGEVMDAYKKYRFQGHESYRDEMIIEASDCLWYLAKLADVLGVTLGEVMERNIEKLKKRFPEGFSKERSINREENKGAG